MCGARLHELALRQRVTDFDGIHEYYDDAQSIEGATPVPVLEDDTTEGIDFGISLPEETGGSISGRVTDDDTGYPVVSAVVAALPEWVLDSPIQIPEFDPGYFRFATTDERGDYVIRGLEAGGYYVFCFAVGYIGEFYDDVRDPREASVVPVEAGVERSGVDFALTRWHEFEPGLAPGDGSVAGAVTNMSGLPIEGAFVYVLDPDGNAIAFARSLVDGRYSLSGLPQGSYYVQASRIGYQTEFFGGAVDLEGSIPIGLGGNSGVSVSSVDFTLGPSSVTGRKLPREDRIPASLQLYQNFPNPFNPETEITYDLPSDGVVSLVVYNLLGQEVRVLVDKYQSAGSYTATWDGKDVSGVDVPSGIYIYRLEAGGYSLVRKAVVLR